MKTGWRTFIPDKRRPWCDIVPENDSGPHDTESFAGSCQCACRPKVRQDDGSYPMVIHNSHDGRELAEFFQAQLGGLKD